MDYSELFTHFLGIIERSIKTNDKPESTAQECASLANYLASLGKSSGTKYHTIYKGDSGEYGKESAVILCHKGTLGKTSTDRDNQIRENELLYDKDGLVVAIKSNGKILPIIEGDL